MGVQQNLSHHCITFLDNCSSLPQLKQIHALLATLGLSTNDPFAWKILSFTATSSSGNINYAHQFFHQIPNPTMFHYNAVIRGFASSKNPVTSIRLFVQMLRNCVVPDHLTYPFLAKASARLLDWKLGRCVHGHVLRNGFLSDLFIANSLIHMYGSFSKIGCARKMFDEMPMRNSVSWNSMLDGYAKCGDVRSMQEVFDVMPDRDVVSWSSLVDGYVKGGDFMEALEVFEKMKQVGPKANEVTMVSLLCACSHLGALERGKEMHSYISDNALPLTLVLRTSLVDMYAKCGAIEEALVVFRGVSVKRTDVLIWNAMIGGLATHGFTLDAFKMYGGMQDSGVKPDEITYLCLLSACAHAGLVKEAWEYFNAISCKGLVPKVEHYACMIDVLARAGCLVDAYRFVCDMPVEPTASMLGALLNGCINHGKLVLAEIVGRRLIELDPYHDGRYVGLSNAYAVSRHWDKVRNTRESMESRGVKKVPGFSDLEVSGEFHRFIAHDKVHRESNGIYFILSVLIQHMKLKADPEILELISFPVTELRV